LRDIVELKQSAKGKSIQFLIPPSIQDGLDISDGDPIQLQIEGIYKEGTEKISVNIPTSGTVVKAGGTSKGITIRKDIVKRFKLKAGYSLEIEFQKYAKIEP